MGGAVSCGPGLQQLQAAPLPKPHSTASATSMPWVSRALALGALIKEIQCLQRAKGICGMEQWKNDGPGV